MFELKSCPFCGNTNLEYSYNEYDCSNKITFYIECPKCEICLERDTKTQAIIAWNTRFIDKRINLNE